MSEWSSGEPGAVALAVLDGLPEGVVVLDREWVYRYVNAAAAAFLQTSAEALLGNNYRDLYPEAVGSPFERAYARVMARGGSEVVDDHYEPWDKYFRNRIESYGNGNGIVIFFSDVTDERCRGVAMQRSQALLQQVVDFAPVGIVLHDLEGRYQLVNRFAAQRAGRVASEMVGHRAADFVPDVLAEDWAEQERQVRASGQPLSRELDIASPHGPDRYQSIVFPTYDSAGDLNGTGAVFSDITARIRAEASVVATEKRYRDMFEHARLGQLVVRTDGRLVDVNQSLCTMLGYTREELLGLAATELVSAATSLEVRQQRMREHGKSGYEYDDEFLHKDGSLLPVAVTVNVMQDPAGEGPLVTSIVRDLSAVHALTAEREGALAELRDAHAMLVRFQALVEASTDFIGISDLDGRIIFVNPAGREMVHLEDAVDVMETTIPDYLTPEGLLLFDEIEHPAMREHGRWSGESSLRDRRGGPAIPVATSSFMMFHPETKEPLALATVRRDITERLAAEEELRQVAWQRRALLDRLVEAQEHERGRIAADVHDDSVQALAAVDLRLGVLHRRLAGSAPELVALVEQVQETVSGATDRLRQLLFDLEPPAPGVSLADAVRDAAAHIFEDTVVVWSVEAGEGAELPPAERVQAMRIVKEAMGNARRHAQAATVVAALRALDGGVEIAVTDDGVGLDPDAVTSRPGHRGLATMRDRATIVGGRWRIERAAQGTTVRFWLPGERDQDP